jgi:hypothetical protein
MVQEWEKRLLSLLSRHSWEALAHKKTWQLAVTMAIFFATLSSAAHGLSRLPLEQKRSLYLFGLRY